MLIKKANPDLFRIEYGCKFRRLLPWDSDGDSPWGSGWSIVEPGEHTTPHSHEETEVFVILSGRALMIVDEEKTQVLPGDVIMLKPGSVHSLRNESTTEKVEMLSMWWTGSGTSAGGLGFEAQGKVD